MVGKVTPSALDWSVDNCTLARAMEILGEKWTVVVLREVFSGVRRFDDMRVRTGIPRQVLTNRLAALVGHGVLRREPYQEPGARVRHEYRLTDKGFDLYPMLIAVTEWGNRYLADPEGPPIRYAHRDCGAEMHVAMRCDDGHEVDDNRAVIPRPGPGAHRRS
ncbi:HxlR family transcriptional regulator [Actinoplanes sp. OR16]|uniref:winged helix-turn-helix transcriptional regulator n=1 Tax=Actinoplanes sp. OR16 TaxID=946334 RepID=UPI000F6DDCBA|nr:helix-turn-helix domain-containing protein [Actinoplanes sp. OR16]BBH63608.1 HxlR family transcriptional regulator [Actinoplanes sp. OR16]